MEGLKKHKIVLVKNVHNEFDNLVNHLKSSAGVISVRYESSSHSIRIQYQLKKITLKEIEEKIIKFGAVLRMGFWHRLVRAIKHYMEINERDNLTVKPLPCCSKPDAILSKQ